MPFRALNAKPEIRWDIAGFIASAAVGTMIVFGLEEPLLDRASAAMSAWHDLYGRLPWWAALPIFVVASDFGAYWAHRLLHTRWLWDAHAWHHSPRYLYFLSGTRAAPLHIVVLIAPYTFAYVLFPYAEAGFAALGHAAFQAANQHYIHSNLRLPWVEPLERLFVTPRFHFVHHSRTRRYCDSNFGFIFSVWDRLFGTYTDPARVPSDEPLGLNYEIDNARAFLGMPPPKRRVPAAKQPS